MNDSEFERFNNIKERLSNDSPALHYPDLLRSLLINLDESMVSYLQLPTNDLIRTKLLTDYLFSSKNIQF